MSTPATRKADKSGKIEDVTGEAGTPPPPTPVPEPPKAVLPTERSKPTGTLADKVIFLYGPEGIGKSTLASEFGDVLFFACEPGLDDLEVYRHDVGDWISFCEGVVAARESKLYSGYVIDTFDMLSVYCRKHTNDRLGIMHESDAEYGKGWDAARAELQRWMGKLAALPGGLLIIGHSNEVEVKSRNQVYTKIQPSVGPKGAREIVTQMADIILCADYEDIADGGERRVLRTKPSKYWVAKERGKKPRLPETVDWPLAGGYDSLLAAWKAGGGK